MKSYALSLSCSFQFIVYSFSIFSYFSQQICILLYTQRKLYCSLLIWLGPFSISAHVHLPPSFLVLRSTSLYECSVIYLTNPLWVNIYYSVLRTHLQWFRCHIHAATNTLQVTSFAQKWELCLAAAVSCIFLNQGIIQVQILMTFFDT